MHAFWNDDTINHPQYSNNDFIMACTKRAAARSTLSFPNLSSQVTDPSRHIWAVEWPFTLVKAVVFAPLLDIA